MSKATLSESPVLDALRQVIDPELGCNIVDLGLIYSVFITEKTVGILMTVTTPGCPMQASIAQGVRNALLSLDGVRHVQVDIVFDPPWHPSMMTEQGRLLTGVADF